MINILESEKFKKLFEEIDNCNLCEYSKLFVNQISLDKRTGKLLTSNYGNLNSEIKILFIGIAPSYRRFDFKRRALTPSSDSENSTGRFFFEALEKSELIKYNLFFTNLIKCSTTKNEFPNSYSITMCFQFLLQELLLIKPQFCICLSKRVYDEIFKRYHRNNLLFDYNITWLTISHPSYYFRLKNPQGLVEELRRIHNEVEKIQRDVRIEK